MPIVKSASKKAVGENIKREMAHGKSKQQAIAIALDVQRKAGGLIHSNPGKTGKTGKGGKKY